MDHDVSGQTEAILGGRLRSGWKEQIKKDVIQKEGKKNMGRNRGGVVGRQRQKERLGCQMTHIKCKVFGGAEKLQD